MKVKQQNMAIGFLDFYRICMKNGKLPAGGLCNSLPETLRPVFKEFTPTYADCIELEKELQLLGDCYSSRDDVEGYWASGIILNGKGRSNGFTKLRQIIILFCAVLNDEL